MGLYRVAQGLCAMAILLIAASSLWQQHRQTTQHALVIKTVRREKSVSIRDQPLRAATRARIGVELPDGIKPKAFVWNKPVPCFQPDAAMKGRNGYRQPANDGILFIKTIKTGSSTATGITMRIAKHTAERNKEKFWICRGRWDHNFAFRMLENRDRSRSFTWTVIRDPTKRATSDFFHFAVSREGQPSSDASFQQYVLEKNHMKNLYLRMLSLTKIPRVAANSQYDSSTATALINQIIADYDFIGVTERMDESAVALAMLLKIPLGDVMYLNAKASGGYDDGVYNGKCHFIEKSFVSEGMKQFFASETWQQTIRWDQVMFLAANISLDKTIENLGKDVFERNLRKFREVLHAAELECSKDDTFPCSSKGEINGGSQCLWSDSGCGYSCLNRDAVTFGIHTGIPTTL